jgi:hypothetical protein
MDEMVHLFKKLSKGRKNKERLARIAKLMERNGQFLTTDLIDMAIGAPDAKTF